MGDNKRRVSNRRVAKSSAFAASVVIHAVIIVAAVSLVVIKTVVKPGEEFVAPNVKRPTMKLRRLQVPVKMEKSSQAPKLRQNLVSKPRLKTVTIKMPEIIGVRGGVGAGTGRSLGGLGFGFDMDPFGASKGSGNEFIGAFYDLKQTDDGKKTEMDAELYCNVVQEFLKSWKESVLEDYFKAPNVKYSIAFAIPTMPADAAPESFGVADVVEPRQWVALYRGMISVPETGNYRFCGQADDVLCVRVKKNLVLNASFPDIRGRLSDWKSEDPDSGKFPLGNNTMVIGDWVHLTAGKPVPVEILIGERPGGWFGCQLLIEQKGRQYAQVDTPVGRRKILPVFKTREIPEELASQIKLDPNHATLDGPVYGVMR
ncbi:MAG: hypothetical protein JXR25_03370 [Pontiellaceae bacterium]|nr:hypothetical protein [Pontiellaceae bacterium]MBN2783843.1 hypothetical protein [Pontiellaceae bacterium]